MEKHKPKYIDAEGVMRACYDSFLKTGNKAYREIFALVEAVPAADVVEMTLENAIDYLHSIGWMQEHDRQMMEMGQEGDEVSE